MPSVSDACAPAVNAHDERADASVSFGTTVPHCSAGSSGVFIESIATKPQSAF